LIILGGEYLLRGLKTYAYSTEVSRLSFKETILLVINTEINYNLTMKVRIFLIELLLYEIDSIK